MPVVLFGTKFWNEVINFDALARYGTISEEDLQRFHRTDSVDEAHKIITQSDRQRVSDPGGDALA